MEVFKGDMEIFEVAIAREVEAYEFYTALAERMIDSDKQKMFEELAVFGIGPADRSQAPEGSNHASVEEVELGGHYWFALDGLGKWSEIIAQQGVPEDLEIALHGLAGHLGVAPHRCGV